MAKQFKGVVNLDVRDSVADWTPFREPPAPEGAPNVLLVLYDDTGLAAWSPYGGRINMPTMQKLADNGLTYTQWHTTALCSPTRSCLLTGRNHHQNGFAQIAEGAQGFPGPHRPHPDGERHHRRGAARERLQHLLGGQEPQRPARRVGGRREQAQLAAAPAASTASTGSSAARPTTGTRRWPRTTTTSTSPPCPRTATTCPRTWPTRRSRSSPTARPRRRRSRGTCGSARAPTTPRTTRPRSTSPSTPASSTTATRPTASGCCPRMVEQGILPEGTAYSDINPLPGEASMPLDHVRPWDELNDDEKRLFAQLRRGLRRLLGVHRRPGRPDHRLPRGDRPARQHDRHVLRRQRRLRRGQPGRHGQREQVLQRLARRHGREPHDARQARLAGHLQPLPDRVGDGVLDAVQDVQALHLPGRRRRPAGDLVAEGHRGPRRAAHQYHHAVDIVPTILECIGLEFPTRCRATTRASCPGSR